MIKNIAKLHDWTLADGNILGVQKFHIREAMNYFGEFDAPVLHIGSKASVLDNAGGKWRKLFGGKQFVGIDMEAGDNVDFVHDITKNVSALRKKTGVRAFSTIICPHVLEHVRNPFEVASNIEKLLVKGGRAIVSVPWVQGYHPFPNDYWRVSFEGMRQLFSGLTFEIEYYSDARDEYCYQLTFNGDVEHSVRTCRVERNLFQYTMRDMPEQAMFDDRDGLKLPISSMYMPGITVNIVGIKP